MKAVNLIPAEHRRAGGGGMGAYVILGALALLVVMATAYALTTRSVSDRQSELAAVQAQAQTAEASAQGLQAYTAFADLSQRRVATVTQLVESRFDWSHAMHEVARTIPSDAWLTSLRGTVSTSTALSGSGAGVGGLRNAIEAPAIELTGCTTSQSRVATMISAMRRIDGVQRVALASSDKSEESQDGSSAGSSAAGAAPVSGGDCRAGSSESPQFSMVVFFTAPPVATTAATTPAAATTTTTPTTPAPTGSN